MTLLERLQHKRELRKIWKPRKPKKIILTATQKAENRAAAEGIAIAIQRQIEKERAAEVEDQKLVTATFKAAFCRECLMNVADVTIQRRKTDNYSE